jgi:transcriptional regulator GlxA family with amidase domain
MNSIHFKCILILLLFVGCDKPTETTEEAITINAIAEGQSFNAGFLLIDGVYNSELMAPYDIFQHTIFHTEGGIKVFTVAPTRDTVTTFEGLKIIPDYSFTDNPSIDILVVPSAEHSMDTDLANEQLIAFVAATGAKADFTISLCDGAFVLAKAGLVAGKESTTFPTDVDRYKATFPALKVHENVSFVHDGNLLTSAGGAKSYDVALYLVHLLYGEQVAIGVGQGLVIDWKLSDYQFIMASKN